MEMSALTLPWQVLTAMFLLFLYKNGLIYSFIEPTILVDFAAGDLIVQVTPLWCKLTANGSRLSTTSK